MGVAGVARTLWEEYGWDPDAACAAAYLYQRGKRSPRSWAQAVAAMMRARCVPVTPDCEREIMQTYLRAKRGVLP